MNRKKCEKLLIDGLIAMKLELKEKKIKLLLDYLEVFYKWNQVYNLSSIREPEKMVSRHLLDSLSLVPFLKKFIEKHQLINLKKDELKLIDVGTGGGLPGFPLAIFFPEIKITLLDSNGKKTRFLFQTALKLGLDNISIENNRVESFSRHNKFTIVTSRAFSSLNNMVDRSEHLIANNGEYWAMKGAYPESELADCIDKVELIGSEKLIVPDMLNDQNREERYLIRLKPC